MEGTYSRKSTSNKGKSQKKPPTKDAIHSQEPKVTSRGEVDVKITFKLPKQVQEKEKQPNFLIASADQYKVLQL